MNIGKRLWFLSGQSSSAFDDIWGWWRADEYTSTNPTISLTDKSGNGRNMVQQAGTLTPGTGANGQARITGNATARLLSSGTLKRWPITIITVGKRTAGATVGFFGHTGASPFNSLWNGYESTDRNFIYNTNGTNNTTAEGGADACYVARIGWGSRVAIVNGVVQADQILSSMVRGSATAVELGTSYRGLNMEWQECLVWDRTLTIDELDEVHAYINTRYSMSIPLWSSYTQAKVIRVRGQSNASGRGDRGASDVNIPAEYDAAITGANVWNGTVASLIGDAFGTLNINSDNHMLGENGTPSNAQTYIGIDAVLCKEYLDANPGTIYLQKWALGSTMLEYTGIAPGHWDAKDETPVHNNTNRNFANDQRNWWKAMRVHQLASRKPVIIGDIWFQGEQDATIEANANAYSSNLIDFFATSDAESGIASTKKLICRIHINGSETYESTVRAQQAIGAAAISGAQLIDTDSYGTRGGDGVHLSVTGQIDLNTYLATLL
jgi:hypothetical protein